MIRIRRGNPDDLYAIISCYEKARAYMRKNGNHSQWINGYPSEEVVLKDITGKRSYVGIDDEGDLVMTFSFTTDPDPTYAVIEGGSWLNDEKYGTIHRLGSTGKHHGMLNLCVNFCSKLIDNIRLDTHESNNTMISGVERLGFKRCGTIYCYDGTPRIAYQKKINS